jgi:hypothetical protein
VGTLSHGFSCHIDSGATVRRNARRAHYSSVGGGHSVKIAAGLAAVLVTLLAMIAAIGSQYGSIAFGDPSTATMPSSTRPDGRVGSTR